MEADKISDNDRLQIIRGLPFPAPFPNTDCFSKKNIEDAMDYTPRDNDLIVASYPKTGTTWMQYIVMQIVSKATLFHSFDDVTHKLYPFMEMVGTAAVEALTGDRIYKHHIPYNMVQKNDKAKCIYTYRHPEDTLVSFYHFYQNLRPTEPLEFEAFFRDFIDGNMAYGSYFKHVLSFYEHRDDSNLLMVSYERLYAERKKEILRVAKFMGEKHYVHLIQHGDVLDKIIKHTSFDYMKKNLHLTRSSDKKEVNFFRKGIVGDGKNVLTEDQRQLVKEAAEALKGTTIYQEWYS